MSGSLNKVMLIGNLGRDPEMKMTPAGKALARFSIATTETWKNQAGEKQTKTEWHNIVVWGKQAEIAEKYLRKGKQVYIEGMLQHREYTDQAGVKRTATDVKCENFVMLGRMEGARDPGPDSDPYDREPDGAPSPEMPAGPPAGQYDDDIPF